MGIIQSLRSSREFAMDSPTFFTSMCLLCTSEITPETLKLLIINDIVTIRMLVEARDARLLLATVHLYRKHCIVRACEIFVTCVQ